MDDFTLGGPEELLPGMLKLSLQLEKASVSFNTAICEIVQSAGSTLRSELLNGFIQISPQNASLLGAP
jgi:hypothetical protein